MHALAQDIRQGLRLVRSQPGFAFTVILTLALGLGLTTTMYSIVHGALRDLPFADPEELIHLERSHLAQGISSMEVTLHDFRDWRQGQNSFEGLAAFYTGTANLAGPESPPERYEAAFLTANGFALLGVEPVVGRGFAAEEEGPAALPVVILGHELWQKRYQGRHDLLGRTVRINSEPHTVIGVMPPGFSFPVLQDLWLPLREDPDAHPRGEGMTLEVYGRLRDGVSLDQAQLELEGIARQLAAEYPDTNEGIATVLKPYTREYVGDEPVALLYTMLGAVLLVLAIACANVANLLLSRAAQRSKEMAVRSALGASRGRGLVSQVTEVLVLAVLAAVPGLGLAAGGIALFNRALVDNPPPYWMSFRIDGAVLVFTALVTVLAAVLASVVPAWRASGGGSAELLKSDGRSTTGRALGRFSRALVVAEITFSCALLIAAGLTIQSVVRLANADFGFDPAPVWSGRLGLFEKDYPDPESRRRFFAQVEERVAALPAVRAAALASVLPATEHDGMRFHWEGETPERVADLPWIRHAVVTPAYFDMLQVAAVEGRLLQPGDRDERLPVALVNRAFVARFSPGESPVGRRLRLAPQDPEEPVRTIVGVVPDLHMEGFDDETPEGVFVPLEQSDMRFASVLVRVGDGQPQALTAAVRSAVTELDPNLPLYFVDTLEHAIYSDGWFYWVFGVLFMVFGAVALFLAAVGLYGVMASSVARRTQEVGIRLALGARAEQVLALVLRQGVWQLALGLGLGLLLAAVSARFMSLILFQVEPRDPLTFAAIAVVLAVTGLAACLVPARRAARIDPVVALKNG